MASSSNPLIIFFFFVLAASLIISPSYSLPSDHSLSFPLTSLPISKSKKSIFSSSLVSQNPDAKTNEYRSSFKYSMALIVSLPVGTPPQTQEMVLDTGSQLSWIQCHGEVRRKTPSPSPSNVFIPSLSSSFSVLPCNHSLCKPRVPDYTLPTSCDQNRLCHYSYFYADGTYAEGNLAREKMTFSTTQTTPPLILGCATDTSDAQGILGMNLGRLSFTSLAKISKFSYCVPPRRSQSGPSPTGSFYLGPNPDSAGFKYVDLLTYSQSQSMPNLDPLAYTLPMQGIRINGRRLNISAAAFRPDPSGAGQTMIDSGTWFTFLVDEAYSQVREEVVRLAGTRLKKGYVYGGSLDTCFEGNAMVIGRMIGNMVFEFEKGVEIVVERERMLADVGGGVQCLGIGRSEMLGAASNIIGNFHQQDMWVEFDVVGRRVGFGRADCTRSV